MFTTIKALTKYMDRNINYVLDAKDHHDCSEVEYESYMESMEYLLDKQLTELKRLSTNQALINKYQTKIFNLF